MAVLRIDQLDPITANTIDTDQMLLPVAGSGVVPTKQQSIQQVVNAALKNQANTLVTGDAPAFSIIARNSSDATGGDVVIQGGNGTADGSIILQNNPASTAAGVQNVVEVNHHGSLVSKIDSAGRVYSNTGFYHYDNTNATTYLGLSSLPTGTKSTSTLIGNQANNAGTSLQTSVMVGGLAGNNVNGINNVCVGYDAGTAATSSTNVNGLIAIGRNSAQSANNTTNTICIGINAGQRVTSSTNSVYIGANAGVGVTAVSGTGNVVIGASAGAALTSGGSNVLVGSSAGAAMTTGNAVAVGNNALDVLTGASFGNVGVGNNAGGDLTTAQNNICLGSNTLLGHTTSTSCIAVGTNAGASNASPVGITNSIYVGENTGTRIATADNSNIYIGASAGRFMGGSTTVNNLVIGVQAGQGVDGSSGGTNQNTIIGHQSGNGIQTGATQNTIVGYASCTSLTSGARNTVVGAVASGITTGTNNVLLGYGANPATATTSNSITLGDNSINTLRCQVTSITGLSDERDKTNIATAPTTLPFIRSLRPVSFTWDIRGGSALNGEESCGFIAQEVETSLNNYSGYANGWMKGLYYGVNANQVEVAPGVLIPALVKSIQEIGTSVTYYNAPSISTPSDGKISLTGTNYDAQIISINQTTNIDFYSLNQIGSRTPYYGQQVKFLNTGISNITINKNDVNGTVNYRLFYSQTANSLSIGRWHTFTATYLKEINNGNDGWLIETTAN